MKVGIVVGRFQIDELHRGHQELLRIASAQSDTLCIVLGNNENRGSRRNPLDFIARKAAVEAWHALGWSERGSVNGPQHKLPLVVLPQQDQPSDLVWSQNLDRMLRQTFPGAELTLYGGRDSFLSHYKGTIKTVNLGEKMIAIEISATARREELARTPGTSDEFRRGVIYGAYNQWPRLFMCVDVAVISRDGKKLYVGKRNNEEGLRFFGGFVDQKDNCLEQAALREAREEAGVETPDSLKYIGSFKVPDYRYKTPDDGLVMTSFFVAHGPQGGCRAGDDIDEIVELDPSDDLNRTLMVDSHQALYDALTRYLKGK